MSMIVVCVGIVEVRTGRGKVVLVLVLVVAGKVELIGMSVDVLAEGASFLLVLLMAPELCTSISCIAEGLPLHRGGCCSSLQRMHFK